MAMKANSIPALVATMVHHQVLALEGQRSLSHTKLSLHTFPRIVFVYGGEGCNELVA